MDSGDRQYYNINTMVVEVVGEDSEILHRTDRYHMWVLCGVRCECLFAASRGDAVATLNRQDRLHINLWESTLFSYLLEVNQSVCIHQINNLLPTFRASPLTV